MKKIEINLQSNKYEIHIDRGLLDNITNYLDSNAKYFVITDDGVPFCYVEKLKTKLKKIDVYIVPKGEKSKSITTYQKICKNLLSLNYSKSDYIIALGGGVVGDLAGYVAATFNDNALD